MAGYHKGLEGVNTNLREVIPPDRFMRLEEETFQVLKEHSYNYYSTATYDEILINLVKFYEQNKGPIHKYD